MREGGLGGDGRPLARRRILAGLGPIDGFLPLSEQIHRGFGVLDVATRRFDLNFGVGAGSGPDSFIVKAIIGVHPPD